RQSLKSGGRAMSERATITRLVGKIGRWARYPLSCTTRMSCRRVMRARIQDFRVKSITSLHIVYSRPSRAGISSRQVAFRNDRDAHFARGDVGSGAAVDTRSSPPVHRLRRGCCWDVSWYVSGNGRASHCSGGPTLSANPVRDHRTNWLLLFFTVFVGFFSRIFSISKTGSASRAGGRGGIGAVGRLSLSCAFNMGPRIQRWDPWLVVEQTTLLRRGTLHERIF